MSLAPTRQAPSSKAVPAGLACRGGAGGVCLASQGPRRGAPPPADGAGLVHVWSTGHRSPAVHNVSCGTSFAQVAGAIQGKQARVQNPDKDAVPGSSPSLRAATTRAHRGTDLKLTRARPCIVVL